MGAEKELRTRSRKCSHTVTAALDLYLGLNPGPRFLSLLLCATPKGTLDAANCLKWEQLCAQPSLDRALCAFAAGGEGSLPLSFQNVPLEWGQGELGKGQHSPLCLPGQSGASTRRGQRCHLQWIPLEEPRAPACPSHPIPALSSAAAAQVVPGWIRGPSEADPEFGM